MRTKTMYRGEEDREGEKTIQKKMIGLQWERRRFRGAHGRQRDKSKKNKRV